MSSSLPLYARFINQVYQPASYLYEVLARNPYCLDPQSNFFLHQYEGLALHCNHFAEKYGLALSIDPSFVDLANSIKHVRDNPKRQIELQSGLLFELSKENKFRFIRNTVTAKYINDEDRPEFDAIEKMNDVVQSYFPLFKEAIPQLAITESKYEFYDWGFGYMDPVLCAYNRATRIMTVKKTSKGYEKTDPKNKNFVVLNATVIGQDPKQYFPEV